MLSAIPTALMLMGAAAIGIALSLPSTAQAKSPHPCVLQPGDVPDGYEEDTPYYETTNERVIARSGNPNLGAVIEKTGRVSGFEAIYAQPTMEALISGPLAIQSWVAIFDNSDGAHAVLTASARGEVLQAPEMGEESIAWKTPPQIGPGGLGSVVIGYAFRRTADVAGWTELVGISVGAVDGVTDIATVSDLLEIIKARGCS